MYPPNKNRRAYTLIELLVVIAIIGILASLLLPALSGAKLQAKRLQCISQQRQLGIGFQLFAHDHNGKFPMEVSTRDGGSAEFVEAGYQVYGDFYFAFRHFQPLSNELYNPKVLVCPQDVRPPAVNYALLQNSNVSYFVGVTADSSRPDSILAGDRNVTWENFNYASLMRLGSNYQRFRWTRTLHQFRGNILFSDGHVEKFSQRGWKELAGRSRDEALVFPSVPQVYTPTPTYYPPGSGGYPNSPPPPPPPPPPRPDPVAPTGSPDPGAAPAKPSPPPPRAPEVANASAPATTAAVEQVPAPKKASPAKEVKKSPAPSPTVAQEPSDPADEAVSSFDRLVRQIVRFAFWLILLLGILLLIYEWQRRQRKERKRKEAEVCPGFYTPYDSK